VLVAPRDYYGVFALDAQTGRLMWDNPFVGSDEVLGLLDGCVLLSDANSVSAVEADTGRLRWHYLSPEGLSSRPMVLEGAICLSTRTGYRRVAAQTGEVLEDVPVEAAGESAGFLVQPDRIIRLADRPTGPGPYKVTEPFNPAAPVKAVAEAPVAPAWYLPRPSLKVFVPPAEAKVAGKVYLAALEGLECLSATPRGAILWRHDLLPEFRGVAWSEGTILLIYPQCVEAVDASTGALRWRTDVAIQVSAWSTAGGRLILAEHRDRTRLAALDVKTGALQWDRTLTAYTRSFVFDELGWDGRFLHLIGYRLGRELGCLDVVVDAADGNVAGHVPLPAPKRENEDDVPYLSLDGAGGCFLLPSRALYGLSLDGLKTRVEYLADVDQARGLQDFKVTGRWVQAARYDKEDRRHWELVFRRDDPSYRLHRSGRGVIRGERLYEADSRNLTVIDLPTRSPVVRYVVPVIQWQQHRAAILDFWEDGNTMRVLSGIETWSGARSRPDQLRLDAFDARGGRHRFGQVLSGIPSWQGVRVVPGEGAVLLVDEDGVHAYSPGASPKEEEAPQIVYRQDKSVVLDGSLDEWDPAAGWSLTGQDGQQGRVLVTHDGTSIYLGVSFTAPSFAVRKGRGPFGGGDRIEFALSGAAGTYRWTVGADEHGGLVWEDSGPPVPSAKRGRIAPAPGGRCVCEIALPIRAFVRLDNPDWRKLRLSVSVRRDRPGGGSARVLALGNAPAGGNGAGGASLVLHPLTRQEEQAGLEIVRKLPDLAESTGFVEAMMESHAASAGAAKAFCRELLKAVPAGPQAQHALELLDVRLRESSGDDPVPEVLRLAEEAGASAEVRQRYAAAAGAYLSQWVYVDFAGKPGMIMLQLYDGNGWEHRVSWGEFQWTWLGTPGTASRRIVPQMPQTGAWQELRVPLILVGMHDRAIRGVCFGQHGGGRVLWGRTAVVAGGKEEVILDGSPREGQTRGFWDWVDPPGGRSTKAHAGVLPTGPDHAVEHAVLAFKTPVAGHVPPASSTAPALAEAVGVLEGLVPKLGPTEESRRFFNVLVRLDGNDVDKRLACARWFLKAIPDHPGAADILGDLLALLSESQVNDPVAKIEGIIEDCRLPHAARYTFRRRFVHTETRFLRTWQLAGPFRVAKGANWDSPLPPEGRKVTVGDQFQGVRGAVTWQAMSSETDYVDLSRLLAESGSCVGYAACWVYSERNRPAVIEIGADDACKVWVNGAPVHSSISPAPASPGDNRVRCYLSAGWNGILVKVAQLGGEWGFYLELVDPEGRGPLSQVRVTTAPPP
jgi:outer membrane protein assembly factor BamB